MSILVAHILHRFAIGGLENGVVNLINHLPENEFRHVVIAVDDYDLAFTQRVHRTDVEYIALRKKPGFDLGVYWRCYRELRRLHPDIVHTRNLSAMEMLLPARMAGIKARVHSEHGRDSGDIRGGKSRYDRLRRFLMPMAQRVVALSQELHQHLLKTLGIPDRQLEIICNGVDCVRFAPTTKTASAALRFVFVGRLQPVKDPLTLIDAFALLHKRYPDRLMKLQIIGDGPLLEACQKRIAQLQLLQLIELTGASSDVTQQLCDADVFVLSSVSEGISNTVLEAMASGLPVVATAVGGNKELVADGESGYLARPQDAEALANAMAHYVERPDRIAVHAQAARTRALNKFSLDTMMQRYRLLYLSVLKETA